jgi:hypothetical protein
MSKTTLEHLKRLMDVQSQLEVPMVTTLEPEIRTGHQYALLTPRLLEDDDQEL